VFAHYLLRVQPRFISADHFAVDAITATIIIIIPTTINPHGSPGSGHFVKVAAASPGAVSLALPLAPLKQHIQES
jgi:hypothetical protein